MEMCSPLDSVIHDLNGREDLSAEDFCQDSHKMSVCLASSEDGKSREPQEERAEDSGMLINPICVALVGLW